MSDESVNPTDINVQEDKASTSTTRTASRTFSGKNLKKGQKAPDIVPQNDSLTTSSEPVKASSGTKEITKELLFSRLMELKWHQKLKLLAWFIIWGFMVFLVIAQVTCIFNNKSTTEEHPFYGKNPSDGMFVADGFNDDPFADRMIMCSQSGRTFIAKSVQNGLKDSTLYKSTTNSVEGYRLKDRVDKEISVASLKVYSAQCQLLAVTIDSLVSTCNTFGFNVSSNNLRVVPTEDSTEIREIPNSLPVIIMPYWDDAVIARAVIPGNDGHACVFRLRGQFDGASFASMPPLLRIVPRSKVQPLAEAWINQPGTWRNGWYETADDRFFSFLHSSEKGGRFDMMEKIWDLDKGVEFTGAIDFGEFYHFGDEFEMKSIEVWFNSIAISNSKRKGFFLYEAIQRQVLTINYTWQVILSNGTVLALLYRWLITVIAFIRAYVTGTCEWTHAGIGCLSSTKSFTILPIFFLPRLHTVFAVFWASGIAFEGSIATFTSAWFIMYISLMEFTLLLFSLLNGFARILCRRSTDVMFGPTLLLICFLHFARRSWRFGNDGRASSTMTEDELRGLKFPQFFNYHTPYDLGGKIGSMFAIKCCIIGLNALIVLIFSDNVHYKYGKFAARKPLKIESILSITAGRVGGLGRSRVYDNDRLLGYEVVRLGYIMFGKNQIINVDDWYTLTNLKPFRAVYDLWNYRVPSYLYEPETKEMYRFKNFMLQDPVIQNVGEFEVSTRDFE